MKAGAAARAVAKRPPLRHGISPANRFFRLATFSGRLRDAGKSSGNR